MFGLFKKRQERLEIKGNKILIDNQRENIGKPVELETVFDLTEPTPTIEVYENGKLYRPFLIETLISNPDLTGQFLHSSIRIFPNSGVMIDGIISKSKTSRVDWKDPNYEAIRLQPFYLSDKSDNNTSLKGKGLFERGLHFSGTVTPKGVRNICTCDFCVKSFTIQHFHAGFSEIQYFYSSDSKETLIVPYNAIPNLPVQLEENLENINLDNVERELPSPKTSNSTFKYYNPFRCPHCSAPYIDFESHRQIRAKEYYGNTYINQKSTMWTNENGR